MGFDKRRMLWGAALAAAGLGMLVGVQANAASGQMKAYARLGGVDLGRSTVTLQRKTDWICQVQSDTVLRGLGGEELRLADLVSYASEHSAVRFEAQVSGSSCWLEQLEVVDGMPD